MTLDQKATTRALQQIHKNTKIGITGHLIVMGLIAINLYDDISVPYFILGVIAQFAVVYARFDLYKKFDLIQYKIVEYKQTKLWLNKHKFLMFLSGLTFGLLMYFLDNPSSDVYFLVLAIVVGMAAGAIYTAGEIFEVYFAYLIGVFLPPAIWMMSQNLEIYTTGVLLMLVASCYFAMTSYKYAKNFRKMFYEEQMTKDQLRQITQQKDTLNHKAHYDDLTDLPNKFLFQDRLEQSIEKSKRHEKSLAVCFINLDNFKIINETLGHNYGDRVLIDVSIRLQDIIRSHDTIARWAGDEFILIVEDLNNENDASIFAQKILSALSEPFLVDMDTFYVTSSIGISVYPRDTDDGTHLIKYADSAMYKAKKEGRNNFKFYSDDMTKVAFERVVMEASLRTAIANEEFTVYYQPQIDAVHNKLIGMEALVRWEHPGIGLISPFRFIPLAEETGLIVGVDKIVMHKAMKQFATWYTEGYNPGVLSLNLATKNLEGDDYLEKLEDSVGRFCLDSACVELELLESDIMKDPHDAIRKLGRINELGIKIAIDDFGTGYSSLSYLKKFPLNKLKIDKSFVDDIPHDEDGKAIVKAIIALGKSLNLNLIAEGVEDKQQRDFLVENGCNNIQGYYYAKPMTADEMEKFMKKMA